MARVNHKKVRQLLNQERSSITDKQFGLMEIFYRAKEAKPQVPPQQLELF